MSSGEIFAHWSYKLFLNTEDFDVSEAVLVTKERPTGKSIEDMASAVELHAGESRQAEPISIRKFLGKGAAASQRSILGDMLDHYQRGYPDSVLSLNIIFAAVLTYLLWDVVDQLLAAFWVASILIIIVWNGSVIHRLRNSMATRSHDYWVNWLIFGNILLGSAWGVGGAILYTPSAPAESMFVLLVIAGMASGVSAIQISLLPSFFAFVVPALIIPSASIFWIHGIDQIVPALLLIVYLGFVTHIALTNRKTLLASVTLRSEKDDLLDEVKESEIYFRALIENAADIIGVLALDGTIQFISPSAYRVLGYTPGELEGRNMTDILHPEDSQRAVAALAEVVVRGKGETVEEHRFRRKDGQWIILESRGRRLDLDQGKILIFARNTTDRAQMEKQLVAAKEEADRANYAKSKFLAQMSHEIRTPMHAILAMAEMLKSSSLDNDQLHRVETLNETGKHLLDLINDILDFSAFESGDVRLYPESFDLHQLVDSVCELLNLVAAKKALSLDWEIAKELNGWRYGDEHRLRQILINLVGNAIKFTDHGSIHLDISIPYEGFIRFVIKDTGRGIEQSKLDNIFNSFVQIESNAEFRGTGLGLAITKSLVKAMDGTIDVRSEVGQGSCFEITLGLRESHVSRPQRPQLQSRGEVSDDLSRLKVLVADDEPINRTIMQDYLQEVVGTLDLVNNGQEAVAKVSGTQYDVILMDMRMPLMDGLTATQVIREQEVLKGAPRVPIIALSAAVMVEERESFVQVGCTSFLSKPVSREVLLEELRSVAG